jgi:single-strand DNA-binding protein
MNNLVITGNLGKDPELKFTQDAKAISNLSLAVGQRIKADGAWIDGPAIWFKVVLFGKQAETAVDRLVKGDTVSVSGRLGEEHWMTKENNPATTLVIYANDFHKIERAVKIDAQSSAPGLKGKDSGVPF